MGFIKQRPFRSVSFSFGLSLSPRRRLRVEGKKFASISFPILMIDGLKKYSLQNDMQEKSAFVHGWLLNEFHSEPPALNS